MNEPLQDAVRDALDARARDLDGATLSRLRQARAHAVAQAARPAPWRHPGWLGALGLAGAALLAVLLWPTPGHLPAEASDDEVLLEIATLDVDLELVEEPEFFEWLGEQPLDGSA